MDRSQIAATAAALRRSFTAAGPDVVERPLAGGHAYLVRDRIVGHIEERPDALRVRLRLPDREQRELETRPTFDVSGRWPALHIVSTEDVAFVERAIPAAYRQAASGAPVTRSVPARAAHKPPIRPPRRTPPTATTRRRA